MQTDDELSTLARSEARLGANAPRLLFKVVTLASAAVLLVLAFMFSLVVFAILMTVGLLSWGYLWWKTRELRRQMYEQPPGARVIEGEVIRDDESRDTNER
ncbi:MAG TPA: hypothetical protein VEG37_04255 [Burkholderiales bacterium]|nr:hypothetical protein [Burkholderiales bacterium]